MTDEDYRKEGGCTKESFVRVWTEINGEYDQEAEPWAVEFEVVKGKPEGTTSSTG